MPRYIDAEEFIEDIKAENTNLMMDGLKGTPRRMALSAKDVIERINEIPTADVQEVVRCKDCKYYRESKLLFPNKFCFRLLGKDGKPVGYNFSGDDFCSRGERKDGDEK